MEWQHRTYSIDTGDQTVSHDSETLSLSLTDTEDRWSTPLVSILFEVTHVKTNSNHHIPSSELSSRRVCSSPHQPTFVP